MGLRALASEGTQKGLLEQMQSRARLYELLGYDDYTAFDAKLGEYVSGPSEVKRGLAGVMADTSAVSVVDEETGSLLYRGYPVPDLAASCSFEEVAYLIWYGELPNATQLEDFEAAERSRREVPAGTVRGSVGVCR